MDGQIKNETLSVYHDKKREQMYTCHLHENTARVYIR